MEGRFFGRQLSAVFEAGFSSKRYEHWGFQSAFHNVPTINGVMQSVGRSFAATRVRCDPNDGFAELQMDIGPAYPAAARVKSWLRTVRLNRGQSVEITEAFELMEAVSGTTLNFLTRSRLTPAGLDG